MRSCFDCNHCRVKIKIFHKAEVKNFLNGMVITKNIRVWCRKKFWMTSDGSEKEYKRIPRSITTTIKQGSVCPEFLDGF